MDKLGKPCCFHSIDLETGKSKQSMPPIICCGNCIGCGWNPSELKRRFREGKFVPALTRLNYETGELEMLPEGTQHLVFRKWSYGD